MAGAAVVVGCDCEVIIIVVGSLGNYNIKSKNHLYHYGGSCQCHSYEDRGCQVHCLYGLLFLALLLS